MVDNLVSLGILILGQGAATPPAGPAAAPGEPMGIGSILDFIIKGGWSMIPIGLCSLVALTIIVERMVVLRRARIAPPELVRGIMEFAHDRPKALQLCRENPSPVATVIETAIANASEPVERLEKQVEEAGQREVVALRHRMRLLSVLPQVATMLGLLGTVFGMIKTFQAIALNSEALGKTEMLAKGIFEAWTCTAAGLLIAIPTLIAYHWLLGRIDMLVAEIDRIAVEWLKLQKARPAAAAEPATPRRAADAAGNAPSIAAAATA